MKKLYPISHPQKRILEAELIGEPNDQYLILQLCKYPNGDGDTLLEAVKNVVTKCADLNLRFRISGDGITIKQYQGEPELSKIHLIDFSEDSALDEWTDTHIPQVFNPVWDNPLYKFHVLKGSSFSAVYITIHHAISDGSGIYFLEELIKGTYKALQKSEDIETIPAKYFSYLDVEKQYKESGDFLKDKEYWLNNLADMSSFPEKIESESSELGHHVIHFDPEFTALLNNYSRYLSVKVTPYKLAMSALGLYLSRRYQAESIPVLMAYSNRRNIGEAAYTTAMLVSTLLLKLDYAPDLTFEEYLVKVAKVMKQALIHSRYPFDILTEDLLKEGSSTNKLFNFSVVSNSIPETEYQVDTFVPQNTAFPLVFSSNYCKEDQYGLQTISIDYLQSEFSEEEIEFMAEGIKVLLEDIVTNSEKKISELAIIGKSEINMLLEKFRGEILAYDNDKTFVDNFRNIASQVPDKIAVVDSESHITYGDLDALSDSVAAELERDYSLNGHFAAIMLPRTKDFLASAISILKAGGAYVPVDPSYPSDRIEYMLADSQASVLITTKNLASGMIEFAGDVLFVDELLEDKGLKPSGAIRNEALAYMIYTSGSTGKPKGVMIRHQSLAAMIAWKVNKFKITGDSNTCVHSSFSFDASIIDLFPALSVGGTLHIISDAMRFDMAGFYQYLKYNKIDDCALPTQLGMELLRSYELPLKTIMLGGEKLKQLPKRNVILTNGYGPTEFTVCSSYCVVDQNVEYGNIPIGKPVPNTWNYVVDQKLQLVPRGCAGELCLSGIQIAKGYWRQEEKTKSVFVDNPFSTCDKNRVMYRTGDLVRWNEKGELEYLGRLDDQVKLRGFRIELGEIESAMIAYSGIESAVVLVSNDILVGYYVSNGEIDESALIKQMSATLPEYMIPVAFKRLDSIPTTPGGKVNKKALPKVELQVEEIIPPANEMQQEIFDAVSGVIGNSNFGVTTDLFFAGMSSLSAIKITAILSKKYEVNLNAQDLIKGKTVVAIEARIKQVGNQDIQEYDKQDYYPLTQSQLGVYFDCLRNPGTLKYNIPFMLKFSSSVDPVKLVKACSDVITAHSYIKTHLKMVGQELQQIRNDNLEVTIPVLNLSDDDFVKAKDLFIQPFNLFEGPLFRGSVYQTSTNTYLLCDFHHLIFDGASVDIFIQDVASAYAGDKLVNEAVTSFECALEEQDLESTEVFKQAKAYFSEKLKSCDGASIIPIDLDAANELQGELKEVSIPINKELVLGFCNTYGITPNNLFLSGLAYAISRFTGNENVLISTITNGRSDVKYQNNLGMMVKTLPLILNVENDKKALDFVENTQQAMFENMSHDCYPFTRISQEYDIKPEIMYAYQSGVVNEYVFGADRVEPEVLDLKVPKFKLSVHIEETRDEFHIQALYNNSLYSADLIETFSQCFVLAVKCLISNPDTAVGGISILPVEHRLEIQHYNDTFEANKNRILHKIFEQHVQSHGDNKALIAIDGDFTYTQLNEKANRIAYALLKKGLHLENLVAFILPRDSRLIATMLGIIKAGGAYIPIDPDYPIERINHILSDSNAKYIITAGDSEHRLKNIEILDVDLLLQENDVSNPNINIKPENLCYLIYTSGSTGRPKGVMLEHKGIANYISPLKANRHINTLIDNASRMLSITTVSFDMFLKESFASLANGVTLVFAGEDQVNNLSELAELFHKTSADAFNATPSRILQYLESPLFREAITQCKVIMAGGEKYPSILYDKLKDITSAKLLNTYGPTEITVSSNGKLLTDNNISVGPPLANVKAYVMDSNGNSLPIGVIGELWIGGEGVARGYWANAAMTRERFININGERYYKTGDLAKWQKGGDINILGRNDTQIKLRGLRIELDEIEKVIYRFTGIDSAVVTIKTINDNEHLCAYFSAKVDINKEELRDFLKQFLPKYMVPTAYMKLDYIPVTPNGKTDLKACPTPEIMVSRDYVAAETEVQQIFCDIYSNILGITQVGIDDDFFDLGGTSLLVTKVTIEAMNKGINISYGDVFTHPTPREMACNIESSEIAEAEHTSEYNYENINALLKQNNIESFIRGEKQEVGNILLLGATGFLGIHILKEFLDKKTGVAYCFIRKSKHSSAEERLKTFLFYYFENTYEKLFNARLYVVEGDITKKEHFEKCKDYPIDTVINCAANVKHFAAGDAIERINVYGVQNCIDFCLTKESCLIQVSTTSVAGLSIDDVPPAETVFDEEMLYVGQNLDNKYVNSKFKAERLVLDAVSQGLNAKIMRVGNLMGRDIDGEFQINFSTNSFINRLRAYKAIRAISYNRMGDTTEFAPIDSTAQAILNLIQAPRECVLFHPYNHHYIYIADVIDVMNQRGLNIEAVEENVFQKNFSISMRDKSKMEALSGLIAYMNMGKGKKVTMLKAKNDYTIQALYRSGFKWPVTSAEYLEKFITALISLNFFAGTEDV